MDERYGYGEYILRLDDQLKRLVRFRDTFSIASQDGAVLFHGETRMIRMKPEIRLYAGRDKKVEMLAVRTRFFSSYSEIVDLSSGMKIGAIKKEFWRPFIGRLSLFSGTAFISFLIIIIGLFLIGPFAIFLVLILVFGVNCIIFLTDKDFLPRWIIMDAYGNKIGTAEDAHTRLELMKRRFQFFQQDIHLKIAASNNPVAEIKGKGALSGRIDLNMQIKDASFDRRLLIAVQAMTALRGEDIQNPQG